MNHPARPVRIVPLLLLVSLLASPMARAEYPFSYQGQLASAGVPHNSPVEMTFRLWDAETGGSQVGGDIVQTVEVVDGLFQVVLDFGSVFDGSFQFLEIEVESTVLEPRQPVLPVPMALLALDVMPGQFWRQDGNAGTTAGTNFLGTTDSAPFEIHVDGQRALRIESESDGASPNLVAGHPVNSVADGVAGATIAGGGRVLSSGLERPNTVTSGDYSTISGGVSNTASGGHPTVGGGLGNTASESFATVSGGSNNTASNSSATVSGGYSNTASNTYATISGGFTNTASGNASTVNGGGDNSASGLLSTVPGGGENLAEGDYSFAAGRRAQAIHEGAFVWADAADADFPSVSANEYAARASGGVRFVVGNGGWQIQPSDDIDEAPNIISGHATNEVSPGVEGATISGGGRIFSGSIQSNTVTLDYSVVSGGVDNRSHGPFATTSGGRENYAAETYATVGGGRSNTAENMSATVGGGNGNLASGWRSTIAGGYSNSVQGQSAMVPGGASNAAAGDFSLAAGRRAKADHSGAFVWADSTDADFASTGADQFVVRATGGVGFGEAPSDYFVINTPFGTQDGDYSFGTGALRVRIDGATRFRVLGNGGVAIGNSYQTSGVPPRGLRVSGVVHLSSLGSAGGDALCRNGSGEIAHCSSSRRYKQDIADLDDSMALVDRLRPVRYRWKDSGIEDIGLVAEEVAEIEPRLVTFDSEGRIEGVKYRQLGAVLVRALQEQRKHAVRMEAELADLRARAERVDALAERNARLEARLLRLEEQMQAPHPAITGELTDARRPDASQ